MQDANLIQQFNPQEIIKKLRESPPDQKYLKEKIQKIYVIVSHTQQQYLPDVRELYYWLVVVNRYIDFREVIVGQKLQRYFIDEFLPIAVKYLILCKRFKLREMMALTQQILIESLNLFVKHFNEIEKYPKLIYLAKFVLDIERYFFKLNFQANYLHLLEKLTEPQAQTYNQFIQNLKVGDQVDALKSNNANNRQEWSRAKIKKVGINIITLSFLNQISNDKPISKSSMQIFPLNTFTHDRYQWRLNLQQGQWIDFEISTLVWKKMQIKKIQQLNEQNGVVKLLGLQVSQDELQWVSAVSPHIQKLNTFSSQNNLSDTQIRIRNKYITEEIDDYNDLLISKNQYKQVAICRSDRTKSMFYVYLVNYFYKIGGLDLIIQKLSNVEVTNSIEVTVELAGLVGIFSCLFYRTYARSYLPKLSESVIQSILNASDSNIRNFSKQKIEEILKALDQFFKRYLFVNERKKKIQFIKLELAKLFIESKFLERKMNSLTIVTDIIKEVKYDQLGIGFNELQEWIVKHKIIQNLYHETSHPQLIARSSDLLKMYLSSNPTMKSLQPLLQLNEAIIKLISQNLSFFPQQFIKLVAQKIKTKNMNLDSCTLNIVKKVGGYQNWLLEKGGYGWVDLVRQKKVKKNDIIQLFKYPFPIVSKIFFQIIKTDHKFIQQFLKHTTEIDYISYILNQNIDNLKKIEFFRPYFKYIDIINPDMYSKIEILWKQTLHVSNSKLFFQTFKSILNNYERNEVNEFFLNNLHSIQNIRELSLGGFMVFKYIFEVLNEKQKSSQYQIQSEEEEEITNPLNMIGMNELINIIFESQKLEVTKAALQYISQILEKRSSNYDIKLFRQGFLEKCLSRLYQSSSYEKYLSILQNILNESEKEGNGNIQPLSYQLSPQRLTYTLINNFSEVKSKMILTVLSNITLYELRHEIGKHINAYGNELKLFNNEKLIEEHFNALTIEELNLQGTLLVTKKYKIEKVDLTSGGKLVTDLINILKIMFDEYSNNQLMSKADCKKFYKRITGDSSMLIQHKVEKIFENYDQDKDGFLKFQEFMNYYESLARIRPTLVWNNLEAYGVREDLKILGDIELTQPDPTTLPRYLLSINNKFMELLFHLLLNESKSVAQCAWKMLYRLPIYTEKIQQFTIQNRYMLRYWLYLLDYNNDNEQTISQELFDIILSSEQETLVIGLKVADKKNIEININEFIKLFARVEKYHSEQKLSYYNKLTLEYSLKIIVKAIQNQVQLQDEFLRNKEKFEKVFLSGLMSKKSELSNYYMKAVNTLFQSLITKRIEVFEMLFNMIYLNFEKCNKKQLSIEYFDLFSEALQLIQSSQQIFEKLDGKTLLQNFIKIFKEHETLETSLNSSQDFVAIGFLKLISKMLIHDSSDLTVQFVEFLFQKCLFPEQNLSINKLKNSKSRRQAYQLIYKICSQSKSNALEVLFKSGFKKIYKSLTEIKISYYFFNEIRSEYGYAGIRNLGCICYMISMIQQFFLTKPFRYLLLMVNDGLSKELVKYGNKQIDDNVLHQFQNIFANLQLTQKQEVNPQDFCLSFKDFEGNPVNVTVQQDAQEFLNMLFDRLQQGIKHTPFKHIIDSVYGGKYCNQFVCSSCKNVIQRHENFFNLSLQIKGLKNIDESFKKIINGEVISDYKCDNCNKKTDTTKRCLVSKLPNYLILYLQRMCFNYDKFENEKVNTRWEFPHEFNIYDYTLQKQKNVPNSSDFEYKLKGIVVHIGSAQFGHYFSYIKSENDQWLQYNDEKVREFDPKDIELQTFGGGTGWRKDNQSAYLLIYEKVQKQKLILQFNSQEQKAQTLKTYKLKQIEKIIPQQIQQESIEKMEEEQVLQTEAISKEIQNQKNTTTAKKVQQKKITAEIDILQIEPYIPQNFRKEISKVNQEYSLQIYVTRNEFMEFLYKITTIDPPQSLKAEFLQLCYSCFSLKQSIGDSGLLMSEQMPKRFNELIKGSGWHFFQKQNYHWNKQIFNNQKFNRISIKKLIISVISDIINTYITGKQTTEQNLQKVNRLNEYLDSFLSLMRSEVQENWIRFEEYFETWLELYIQSDYIKRYAQKNKMIEILLDFILENKSPLKLIPNRTLMKSRMITASFSGPLELLFEIIGNNHQFTENQLKCAVNYSFLEKIIKMYPKKINIIENLCKENSLISERVAYSISSSLVKVTHSDDSKPLIQSIHQYLNIKDSLTQLRKQWLIGLPQLEFHGKTNSFGIYGLTLTSQPVYTFLSPLDITPVLQIINNFKDKYQHISILLVSMVLQLEKDGVINLNEYPAFLPLNNDFTFWFGNFVQNYHEQILNKPYAGQNYKNYAKRAYALWKNRIPNSEPIQRYVIGKVLAQKQIRNLQFSDNMIELKQIELQVPLLQSKFEQNGLLNLSKYFLHKTNPSYFTFDSQVIDSYQNADLFLKKVSSYQTKVEEKVYAQDNPFENILKTNFIRKIVLKNNSNKNILVLVRFVANATNTIIPKSIIRIILKPLKEQMIVIQKIDPHKDWDNYDFQVSYTELENQSRFDECPKQLITPFDGQQQQEPAVEAQQDYYSYYQAY